MLYTVITISQYHTNITISNVSETEFPAPHFYISTRNIEHLLVIVFSHIIIRKMLCKSRVVLHIMHTLFVYLFFLGSGNLWGYILRYEDNMVDARIKFLLTRRKQLHGTSQRMLLYYSQQSCCMRMQMVLKAHITSKVF